MSTTRTFGGGAVADRDRGRSAAFALARCLADPAFRKLLSEHGCQTTQDVVVAVDDEPASTALERVATYSDPPTLLAIQRPGTRWGFVFLTMRPAESQPADDGDSVKLGETTSIGMLYDAMVHQSRTLKAPNSWYRGFDVHRLESLGV